MKTLKTFLLLYVLFFSVSLSAEDGWYQVEIVVFDRLYPNLDGERWAISDYQPRSNLVELIPADQVNSSTERVPFSVLPAAKNRLSGTYRVFKVSSNYRPLIHYSWQQPATERRASRFVHIQKLADGAQPVADTLPADEEPAFIEDIAIPDSIIDGAIRVRSGFYLHVDVDLTYFTTLAPENRIMPAAETTTQVDPFAKIPVQLKGTRKIKLNEIHYFDHPMFGLMLQVSRL